MSDFENTIWCAGCGTEIVYLPYVIQNQDFCCQDCALGVTCQCGRALEREEDYRDQTTANESIYPGN